MRNQPELSHVDHWVSRQLSPPTLLQVAKGHRVGVGDPTLGTRTVTRAVMQCPAVRAAGSGQAFFPEGMIVVLFVS